MYRSERIDRYITTDYRESIFTYHSSILDGIHLTCPQGCICGDLQYDHPVI
jgi:hypothetical protein